MLQIYNTQTKKKEPFQPMHAGRVSMYVCGVTVYDLCHIGHARCYIAFDMISRYLQSIGYHVIFVRNITDIDDKIIKKSVETEQSCEAITATYIQKMHQDFNALGIQAPTHEPRATAYMPEMISLIQRLVDQGFAYEGGNGDVYYDVGKKKDYGKLSKRQLEEMQAGARVDINEAKRHPFDFTLWKQSKPTEPFWDSPWGKGRPGWHLECSAMSMDLLGETFDIHGGGQDLIFPHHENECAQSEAATGKPFVKTWMHVGSLQINKEKMSKSLGNFSTIEDVLKNTDAETLRYFFLSGHYRSPLDFDMSKIKVARTGLERLYIALRDLNQAVALEDSKYEKAFHQAMQDDFNTPEAYAVLFELAREINKSKVHHLEYASQLGALLVKLGQSLGLLMQAPENFLNNLATVDIDEEEIKRLIVQRKAARANKDFQQADQIRKKLLDLNIMLEDTPDGTIWRKC